MNFRAKADMFVAFPKNVLSPFQDLTMPRRDWSRLAAPACWRLDARTVCAARFGAGHERRQAAG